MTSYPAQPAPARPVVDALSVAFVALSICLSVAGLAYRPALLTPAAVVVSLAAVLLSTRWRQFAAAAVVVAGLAWLVGMTIAVLTTNPLY